jgi:hypothetical protein
MFCTVGDGVVLPCSVAVLTTVNVAVAVLNLESVAVKTSLAVRVIRGTP